MRKSELDWIEQVILTSNLASRSQRRAIVQRIRDAYDLRTMILRSAEGINEAKEENPEPSK